MKPLPSNGNYLICDSKEDFYHPYDRKEKREEERDEMSEGKCAICKKYFDYSNLYEYRGIVYCEKYQKDFTQI